MKAPLLSLLPGTVLTVLVATTAALRFYDGTDVPPTFPPHSPRQWSFWLFTTTILVAMVDFGIRWWIGNLERDRQAQERERQTQREQREAQREQRETQKEQREIRRDLAILSYLAHPTEDNRRRLEATCQEIEQSDLESDLDINT